MIPEITELNFPSYATLSSATATLVDMGDKTIVSKVKISGTQQPDFSFDWAVMFKGNKYVQPLRTPQGNKDNTSFSASVDLTFQHWAIYQLKRYYFVELTSLQSGTAMADKYIASVSLNLGDFVILLNSNLAHYFGDSISVQLNPDWTYDAASTPISISYSYLWDVVQQIYELFAVRWTIEPTDETANSYVIKIGYDAPELSHVFEYGYSGGLLKFERQVQSAEIRNELLGRGGDTNLPKYYFKTAPDGAEYASDPDANEELANVYFSELRGKTFRDYVKGWNNAHHGGSAMATPTWAYTLGNTDTKFNPVEYVKDDDSIIKYGELIGGIGNQEDIYPSIQGAPNDLDKVVAVEEITSDDVYDTAENNSVVSNINSASFSVSISAGSYSYFRAVSRVFSVPDGQIGVLSGVGTVSAIREGRQVVPSQNAEPSLMTISNDTLNVYRAADSIEVPPINIPTGDYYFVYNGKVSNNNSYRVYATVSYDSVKLTTANDKVNEWKPTFDIWIKNIWGTTKGANETSTQYADRVWIPILNEDSSVSFSSGLLSQSEDYSFVVNKYAYNEDANIDAEWILTLAKSDAEAEASGIWIPSMAYNAVAGDGFYFTGIDMPQQYVEWAEERLDNFKTDELGNVSDIQPTYSVDLDSVRIGTSQGDDTSAIIDQLEIGAQILLMNNQFLPSNTQLYITNVTYTWNEVTDGNLQLTPSIAITLSNDIAVVKNPISQISGEVTSLQKQVGSISNIQQIVRAIGDKLYLRKDGLNDISYSATKFASKITDNKYTEGIAGGSGWGITRDGNGNSVAEFDIIKARKELQVNNLVVNQVTAIGGKEIFSAAAITCTNVIVDGGDYTCYFDQKRGSVMNLFQVGDIAMSQVFSADLLQTKYYKRRVIAKTADSITLSATDVNGAGIPMIGDTIVQYGSYSDADRQYVIIRDVIGGGYERMLSGLTSVNTDGQEYYFVGRMSQDTPRWHVGDSNGYIEYQDGILTISGSVITSSLLAGTISVSDEDGNPVAGMSGVGGTTPVIWAGSNSPTTALTKIYANGLLESQNANITGILNATQGTFNNVQVNGSIRSPFTQVYDGLTPSLSDNFFGAEEGLGMEMVISLEWDISQSGRRIIIFGLNYISAPNGKYFFEGGAKFPALRTSGGVELIGVTDLVTGTEFAGWMVINRFYYELKYNYGKNTPILAFGTIKGTSSSAILSNVKTFDNSTLSVTRMSKGKYKLVLPNSWFALGDIHFNNGIATYADISTCFVTATGLGPIAGGTYAIKANVYEKRQILDGAGTSHTNITETYILFNTSDDASENDGSLMFMVYNTNAWI